MADPAIATQNPATPSPRSRRRWLLAASVTLLALIGAYGWYWWTAPEPPPIDLSGDHPAVAEAIETARAAVRRSPRSGAAWGELGMVLFANGHESGALACFAQAERFEPDSPTWPYLQASQLLPPAREEGLRLLRRAVDRANKAEPETQTLRLLLAEVLFEKGEDGEAAALCREVLAQMPDHPRAHFDLGLIALTQNDPEQCIANLTVCVSSPFAAKRACIHLAAACQRLGDASGAAAFVRRAAKLPEDQAWPDPFVMRAKSYVVGPQMHQARAEGFLAKGQQGQGLLMSLRELAEESGDGMSHWRLGTALASIGDFEAAEAALRTALQKSPGMCSAKLGLGVVLMRQGDRFQEKDRGAGAAVGKFREAAEFLRQAAELRPAHGLAHMYLGQCLQRLGQLVEARTELRTAVQCQPELADVHLHLGDVLTRTGDRDEARKQLLIAQSLAPSDPRPREAMARLLDPAKIIPPPPKD
jgi:Flp pilus assembly protein TadD